MAECDKAQVLKAAFGALWVDSWRSWRLTLADVCVHMSLSRVLLQLCLKVKEVFPSARSGDNRALLSLVDESACPNVAFHSMAWVVTIRSRCCLIPLRSGSLGFSL